MLENMQNPIDQSHLSNKYIDYGSLAGGIYAVRILWKQS
jgi:hypothetical protein